MQEAAQERCLREQAEFEECARRFNEERQMAEQRLEAEKREIEERRNQMQGIIEEHQRRQGVLQECEKPMGSVVDSERVKQEMVVFEADRYPLAAEQQRGENEAEPESSDRATKKRQRSSSLQEGPENTPLVIRQRSPQRQSARDMMRDKSLGRGKSRWDQGPSV